MFDFKKEIQELRDYTYRWGYNEGEIKLYKDLSLAKKKEILNEIEKLQQKNEKNKIDLSERYNKLCSKINENIKEKSNLMHCGIGLKRCSYSTKEGICEYQDRCPHQQSLKLMWCSLEDR